MQDAGIAILESFDAEIYDNTFENVKYGIRISLGGADNHIHDNVFDTCSSCESLMHARDGFVVVGENRTCSTPTSLGGRGGGRG